MNQFLVVLRGAPSSGKTTISKRLRNFGQKIAWLKVDNFKDFFAEDTSEALEYVNGSAVATLEYLFDEEFSVVMDGVFQDTKSISQAVEVASKKNIRSVVYEIKCSLHVLLERDKNREGIKEGFRKPLADEVIEKIYSTLISNPFRGAYPLDTENLTIEDCITKIKHDISN